jgi:Flp pilus assembly protein CpaB
VSTRPVPATGAIPTRSKRKRAGLPFIIGGGALALLTFVGVLFYTSSASGGSTVGNVPVVVAAHDLAIRVPIHPADLVVAQYRESDAPPGAFSKIADLANVVAAVNISKGQPVTNNLVLTSTDVVIGPQSAYLPIPTGFVALTIPTGEQVGVAGYIQVGDYISLVANVTGKTATNVRTVFTNVPVIRVGAAQSESAPVQGSSSNPPKTGGLTSSLTVVVTQCQAEFVSWFLANGGLRYTLESYHDYKPQDVKVDANCPDVNAAGGVTATTVAARWPGILS